MNRLLERAFRALSRNAKPLPAPPPAALRAAAKKRKGKKLRVYHRACSRVRDVAPPKPPRPRPVSPRFLTHIALTLAKPAPRPARTQGRSTGFMTSLPLP